MKTRSGASSAFDVSGDDGERCRQPRQQQQEQCGQAGCGPDMPDQLPEQTTEQFAPSQAGRQHTWDTRREAARECATRLRRPCLVRGAITMELREAAQPCHATTKGKAVRADRSGLRMHAAGQRTPHTGILVIPDGRPRRPWKAAMPCKGALPRTGLGHCGQARRMPVVGVARSRPLPIGARCATGLRMLCVPSASGQHLVSTGSATGRRPVIDHP